MSFIKRYGFSCGLTAAVTGFIMALYCSGGTLALWFLGALAVSTVCFLFFNALSKMEEMISKRTDKLAKRKKFVWLFYLVVMEIVLITMFVLLREGGGNESFLQWLFKNSSPNNLWFQALTALGAVFFVSSAAYYFTQILHRSAIVFLLLMVPFALYGKVNADFPIGWTLLIAVMFFAVWTQGRFLTKEKETRFCGSSGYFAAVAVFGIFVGMLAWATPKPLHTPFREEFDRFAERMTINVPTKGADFTDFANISGVNRGNNQLSDEILYEVEAEESLYLRTQCYDIYNPSGWGNLSEEEYSSGWNGWERYRKELSHEKLIGLLKWAAEEEPQIFTEEQLEWIAELSGEEEESSYYVRPIAQKSYRLLFSHLNQTDYQFAGRKRGRDIYRTRKDEYFLDDKKYLRGDEGYQGTYYKNHFSVTLAKNLTAEEFSKILNGLNELDNGVPAEYEDTLGAWRRELNEAEKYRGDTEGDYRGKELIAVLAQEITAGAETEYEKALAIERYFYNGDFTYDLDFAPEKEGAEYFLLESRRGICSDFATAMTLLAREAGLSARYTEGAKTEQSEDEQFKYVIKASSAHAFPEIYIPGNGWTIFEPTIPQKGFWETFWEENRLWVLLGCTLFLSGGLVFILRHQIGEGIFCIAIAGAPHRKAVAKMFKRLCRMAEKRFKLDRNKITAGILSEALISKLNVNPEEFIGIFERTVYGDKPCGQEEYSRAFASYKLCRKAMLSRKNS